MTDQAQGTKAFGASIWPWLFAALGIVYLLAAVRGGEEVTYSALKGIGFLLATPQARLDHVGRGRVSERAVKLLNGLGYLGIALIATGLIMDVFNL
jgi:hypothetical protein